MISDNMKSNTEPIHDAGQDLYYAFTHVDPERVHITLTIDDFDCITEDRGYLFYNRGDQKWFAFPSSAGGENPLKHKFYKNQVNV